MLLVSNFSASGYLTQMSTGQLILQKQNFDSIMNLSKKFNHLCSNSEKIDNEIIVSINQPTNEIKKKGKMFAMYFLRAPEFADVSVISMKNSIDSTEGVDETRTPKLAADPLPANSKSSSASYKPVVISCRQVGITYSEYP